MGRLHGRAPVSRSGLLWYSSLPPESQKQLENDQEGRTSKKSPPDADSSSFWTHWKEQLGSTPNRITLARIASAPALSYLIVHNHTHAAVAACFFAGISDVLDGYLARNYNMKTTLGTYLDPLADKIMINTVAFSLYRTGTLPGYLMGLWLTKDVGLVVGSYWHVRQRTDHNAAHVMDPLTTPLQIQPTLVSKWNTALQFLTLGVGILDPVWTMPYHGLEVLCWTTSAGAILSAASYVGGNAFRDNPLQRR